MGTDIHMVVETKVYDPDTREDLGWQLVPGPIITCFSCNGTGFDLHWDRSTTPPTQVPTDTPCYWCTKNPDDMASPDPNDPDAYDERPYYRARYVGPGKTRDSWYSDRNYVVFAVLGNVRNGHGFAGIYSHDPLPFLSDRRGLPDDMSDDAKVAFDAMGGDHSDTWLTLEEVLKYDWDQTVHKTGVLDLGAWYQYRTSDDGLPQSWSGDISGGTVTYVTPAEMDEHLAQYMRTNNAPPQFHTSSVDGIIPVTRLQWGHPLGRFAEHFLERMRALAAVVGETPTRLIFNFDS